MNEDVMKKESNTPEIPDGSQPAQPVGAAERVMPYTGLEAASMMRTVIDDILAQSKGTHETAHQFVSWHLPRIRSLLTDIDAALAHPRPTGDECRIAPVEKERFEAWMKRSGANIRTRPDGVYADHTVMCCWNSWLMSAGFKTDTSLTTVPYALADVVRAVRRFDECAEDGEDVDLGRDWFDALTTLGLLARVQRSPARWEMTDAGHSLLALPNPTVSAHE